jgi:hypothetical protein
MRRVSAWLRLNCHRFGVTPPPFQNLPWRHKRRIEVQLYPFFNLGDGWEWLPPRPLLLNPQKMTPYPLYRGTAVAQWLRCCATNRKVAGSIPNIVIGIFHWHRILPIALWPWGRLKQKWVPGAFPGGKGGRCVRLTTSPPSCAVFMKSGNLNFLEPSVPLRACNGTDLPFYPLYRQLCGP